MYYTYDYLELNGRLGNQLWQIAWQFGEADRRGGRPLIKPNWMYRPYFSIPDEFFGVTDGDRIDGGTGYYQELLYFNNVKDRIREYFQPRHDVIPDLKEYCSLHVRRGDYLNRPDIFPACTPQYYHDAVSEVKTRDMKFIVFSDDVDWCRNSLGYLGLVGQDVIFVEPVITPVEVIDRGVPGDQLDLFSMMGCAEHILSNSTFSWWGAWLSHSRQVYYPSVWFRGVPNWETSLNCIPDDPRWIKVQV
jgi:hypothetical protein